MKYIINKKLGQLYLTEADLIKQNYNCPADEKTGEGKGSCGGNDNNEPDESGIALDKIEIQAMRGEIGQTDSERINIRRTTMAMRHLIVEKTLKISKNDVIGLVNLVSSKNPASVKDAKDIINRVAPKSYFAKGKEPIRSKIESTMKSSQSTTNDTKFSINRSLNSSQIKSLKSNGFKNIDAFKAARIQLPSGNKINIIIEDKKHIEIAQKLVSSIPEPIAKNAKEIIFSEQSNNSDQNWSEKFGRNFVSAGSCDRTKGKIYIYRTTSRSFDSTKETFMHELGHSLDKSNRLSYSKEYGDAAREDSKNGKGMTIDNKSPSSKLMGFVTKYARDSATMYKDNDNIRNSRSEDFAESIKLYTTDKEKFSRDFPARYKYFKNIFGE